MIELILISFLEALISPIPPDFLLIYFIIKEKNWESVIIYPLITLISNITGGMIGYLIGKYFKEPIKRFIKKENYYKVRNLYYRYGDVAIILSSLTPIPYKIFCYASGILEYNFRSFIILSLLFRGIRFYAVSFSAFYFGENALAIINSPLSLAIPLILVVAYVIFLKLSKNWNM